MDEQDFIDDVVNNKYSFQEIVAVTKKHTDVFD